MSYSRECLNVYFEHSITWFVELVYEMLAAVLLHQLNTLITGGGVGYPKFARKKASNFSDLMRSLWNCSWSERLQFAEHDCEE